MAEAYRSVMEVLKWAEPITLLKSAAVVSRLWTTVSNTEELWREQIDTLAVSFPEEADFSDSLKLRYKATVLLWSKELTFHLTVHNLQVYNYRKQQVVKELSVDRDLFDGMAAVALVTYKVLFVCGGSRRPVSATMFSLMDGSSSSEASMHDKRAFHSAVIVSPFIYVFGGFPGPCSRTAEVFDMNLHAWRNLPNMHTIHSSFTACLKEKLIYICGGHCRECETFNVATEVFERVAWDLEQANWTVSLVYQDEVVTIIGNTFYVLKKDGWERKDGQLPLIP